MLGRKVVEGQRLPLFMLRVLSLDVNEVWLHWPSLHLRVRKSDRESKVVRVWRTGCSCVGRMNSCIWETWAHPLV